MGNCTRCVQQQHPQQQVENWPDSITTTTTTPSSLFGNISRSFHRDIFANLRTSQSHNLNALIDETLAVIRTVIDTDQEPPHAMLLVSRIANREDRWLDVIVALVERIPIDDPLGATVIGLLLDECSLPSRDLVQQLIKRLCSHNQLKIKALESIIDEHIKIRANTQENSQIESQKYSEQVINRNVQEDNDTNESTAIVKNSMYDLSNDQQSRKKSNKFTFLNHHASKTSKQSLTSTNTSDSSSQRTSSDNLHIERNTLIVLGCLAEKLVGPTSTSMLKTNALEYLLSRVHLGTYGYEQLNLIDAKDKNSSAKYSSVLKIILSALIALEKFSHTSESKYILLQSLTNNNELETRNILEYYEQWALSNNCLRRQIGFYSQWLLDNVFLLDHRRPTYEIIDHRSINVMLNDKDVSEYLKIGPDGLEARSDTASFESVRCTFSVNADIWYYEVLIITDGVMQIGWAAKQSKFMNHEGYGIGDDQYSVAYDGCRNLIWYGAKSIPHNNPAWKSGDIVGCLIDFDRREVIFSLNGRQLDPFRKLFSASSNTLVDGYFAAASFMSYQHCRFNFGAEPFRYPPKTTKPFKTFNDYGHLLENEKLILPKYKKLELLRLTKINEQDCILCVNTHANIILKPCQHTGFCEECAYKVDICPICRSNISMRSKIST